VIGGDTSTGPDGIPRNILQLCREATILSLAQLLDIMINKAAIPRDWKKSHSGSYLQGVRLISSQKLQTSNLISVVCKQMKHIIAGYLSVWETWVQR